MLLHLWANLAEQEQNHRNSCGHTTDFYRGKTDLPPEIFDEFALGKSVLPR